MRTEGTELRALVPVSIRSDDERGSLGNRIAAMRGPLPVYVEDPVERLRVVQRGMGELKESKQALGAEVIAGLTDFAPPTLLAQASRLNFSTRLFNLIVTNVPGPQFPLYLLGREMQEIVPIAFLPENHALAIAIMSYNGKVDFGLLARLRRHARPRRLRRSPRGVARRAAGGSAQGGQGQRALERQQEGRNARHGEKEDAGLLMRHRPAVALALAVAGLIAPAAEAAPPNPFGHACAPQDGVLFCPTATDAERVPTLRRRAARRGRDPAGERRRPVPDDRDDARLRRQTRPRSRGSRPSRRYNNIFYAQQGYAVVNYSARGFGRSCGRPDSRTSPGCDAGWIHLADHRYEARDTQHLLGLLVDQGVAKAGRPRRDRASPTAASRASTSRGCATASGCPTAPSSPGRARTGRRSQIAAAYARWPGSDLTYALQPNGRFLDFRTPRPSQSIRPGGVMKKSYNDVLYASGNATGFYAPKGGAFSSDITTWKELADRGEPARADALAVGTRAHGLPQLGGPHAARARR